MAYTQADLDRAVASLRSGGVVLYPTDTVWGIGCDATRPDAVERIFTIKRRVDSKAMLSLVDSEEMLRRYAAPGDVDRAMKAIDPARPTTVIYPSVKGIASGLVATDGSAGFRICGAEFAARLCRELGKPVVSTSANISGHPAPARFADISPEITAAVDYVVEYGRDDAGSTPPSRIVKLNSDNSITVLRP